MLYEVGDRGKFIEIMRYYDENDCCPSIKLIDKSIIGNVTVYYTYCSAGERDEGYELNIYDRYHNKVFHLDAEEYDVTRQVYEEIMRLIKNG